MLNKLYPYTTFPNVTFYVKLLFSMSSFLRMFHVPCCCLFVYLIVVTFWLLWLKDIIKLNYIKYLHLLLLLLSPNSFVVFYDYRSIKWTAKRLHLINVHIYILIIPPSIAKNRGYKRHSNINCISFLYYIYLLCKIDLALTWPKKPNKRKTASNIKKKNYLYFAFNSTKSCQKIISQWLLSLSCIICCLMFIIVSLTHSHRHTHTHTQTLTQQRVLFWIIKHQS